MSTTHLPDALRFNIYLPACYANHPDERYPVLYLFHGQTYDENQWARIGAPATADRLITAGDIPPLIIVMPYDPSWKQPTAYGFSEAVTGDLIPYIDSHYRTLPDRAHRAVGGLSRGAGWAIHFGLTHPDLFGALGAHSPVIFSSEGSLISGWLADVPPESMPRIFLDIGENDQNLQNARWFEDILNAADVPHEWYLNTGFHDEAYWSAHVEEYLRWYAAAWK